MKDMFHPYYIDIGINYFDIIKVLFYMNYDNFSKPILTEPGVKYFLNETLKQCREFKITYNNSILNISLFVIFFIILGALLLIKYKGKLTPSEKDMKNKEKQQYILTKIKNYQDAKQQYREELITGLPQWETEYDMVHRKL
jgi:hypothetical protein